MQKLKSKATDARRLVRDKDFRKRLLSAIEHGSEAARHAALRDDERVRKELRQARAELEQAYRRARKQRRSHKLRNLLVVTGLAAVAALVTLRHRLAGLVSREPGLDELTREELYARAQEADIPGRSEMTKQQLADALRARG